MVSGTDRSTMRRMAPKSYFSGTLNRERGGGDGGGAAISATSVAMLAAAVDLLAHAEHAARAASAGSAHVVRIRGPNRWSQARELMGRSFGMALQSVSASCYGDARTCRKPGPPDNIRERP